MWASQDCGHTLILDSMYLRNINAIYLKSQFTRTLALTVSSLIEIADNSLTTTTPAERRLAIILKPLPGWEKNSPSINNQSCPTGLNRATDRHIRADVGLLPCGEGKSSLLGHGQSVISACDHSNKRQADSENLGTLARSVKWTAVPALGAATSISEEPV